MQLEEEEPHGVGARFLRREQPSLEAQLCNLADEISYNAHDIDDGVRSGLITLAQLQDVPLFDEYRASAEADHPELAQPSLRRRLLYEAIRRMLSAQVYDVIDATQAALLQAAPADCVVIEDSPTGVAAARAAGMTVYGYAAMTDPARLQAAGAHRVFRHMADVPALLQ